MPRDGVLVHRIYERLDRDQMERIHGASMEILHHPGIICYNREAADIFSSYGAEVTADPSARAWGVSIPEALVLRALETTPKVVKLGARREENSLILDGSEPRVFFASGSETNTWLDMRVETFVRKTNHSVEVELATFHPRRGMLADLCTAARLGEHLDNLDGFIRPVNIQDDDITEKNKDVNMFFACLNNMTKHVMAGLTSRDKLDEVIRMAEIIVGGDEELRRNPIISFITCVFKSPLQLVDDTTQKYIEMVKRGMPVVISASPQGGSTAPIKEDGMVAQINAEILGGIALSQLINPGAPVIYGSVPTRAGLDDLADSYGVPEFNQYNVDCVQMARFYGLPCYSTAGVADVKVPGIQATVEKLFSHIVVALSGAQYIHYAFGLLDKTATFCPVQAVMDDAHIGMVKALLRAPKVDEAEVATSLEQIRQVMPTSQKLFVRYIRPKMRSGEVTLPYPFEGDKAKDEVLLQAHEKLQELLQRPVEHISPEINERIFREVPGILPRLNIYREG
ncbi:MAG: trimethylamine methyltransferase family protein [Dehalococcoidia bacterium]|jgi:trimethylamine--corrinoid protein Co-methyltransferase|nr:trimethylamine methyltransferase family protein [Chloroflexota bacterium]MCK4242229.1 trimethylamine methyltransferase family protein [Dehalococcoidia bacterium]